MLAASTTLQIMKNNNMNVKDIEAAVIVQKADEMLSKGYQKVYIVQRLSEEHRVSVRSIYSMIKRLHSDVILA